MKKRIGSTVVIGIFIVYLFFHVIFLWNFNLTLFKNALANPIEGSTSYTVLNEMIDINNGVAEVNNFTLSILGYGSAFTLLIISLICLLKAIRNRDSIIKGIRITNYVYDAILAFYLIFAVIKIIIFVAGIA